MITKTITTDSKTFTVREMTTRELRAWWNGIATPGHPCDVVDEYAVPGISLNDLAMLCDCEVSAFDHLSSRELEAVAGAAMALNPAFFRLRESVAEASAKIIDILTEAFTAARQGEVI